MTIDFDNTVLGVNNGKFNASGFNAAPGTGQLDSDGIIITGLVEGDLTFGTSGIGGGYARGTTSGNNMTNPGVYALLPGMQGPFPNYQNFTASASGNLLALQPDDLNFAPGSVIIRAQNATARPLSSISVSADYCSRSSSGPNSATYTFAYSTDNVNYTPFFTNTTPTTTSGQFPSFGCLSAGPATATGLNVAPGEFIYVRFSGSAGSLAGSYDQVAIDNIRFFNAVLPVDLVRFVGETSTGNGTTLNWTTAWEQNSDYFEVQRSQDGRTFTGLDEVSAAGFTDTETSYSYLDKTAPAGTSYYRLRQVDFDGTEDFSAIISVARYGQEVAPAISVAPNPTTGTVRVRSAIPLDSNGRVQVIGADGRLLIDRRGNTRTELEIDLGSLPAGTYHLRIVDAQGVRHFPIQRL